MTWANGWDCGKSSRNFEKQKVDKKKAGMIPSLLRSKERRVNG